MENTQALREKNSALAKMANQLLAEKGDQIWLKEEQDQFDNWADEMDRISAQINASDRMREREAETFFNATGSKKEQAHELAPRDAVALYLRNGQDVSPEQAILIRNVMSTTTTTEGGFTVPSEIASMIVDALKEFGGMREVAEILPTTTGNALNFPTSDGTTEEGEILGENAPATTGDITFGTAAVNPFLYSSKKIALPWQLVQDSAVDIVAFVVNRLVTRLGRITNKHYTIGTGTGQPFGVIPRATVGKTGITGQTLTVIYDDLVDLAHSVNRAYRRNGRYMLNDLSVAIIRKIKDTTGRPIWNPGDAESISNPMPSTICGYPYVSNDDVATMAANARSIAFGDFKKYMVRDVSGDYSLRRFDDSAFALNGQVGFCGWMRSGGNLVDTAAVKVYVNSAT